MDIQHSPVCCLRGGITLHVVEQVTFPSLRLSLSRQGGVIHHSCTATVRLNVWLALERVELVADGHVPAAN